MNAHRLPSLCQLARDWQGDVPAHGFIGERKHDGWRALRIDGKLWTRNGEPYRGTGHIERALALLDRQFDRPMFYDGEFVVGDGLDTLEQTKAHQERGWRGGDAGVLWLFDAVPLEDWRADRCEMPLYERKNALAGAIVGMSADPLAWEMDWNGRNPCPVRYVEDCWLFDMADAERFAADIWGSGGEGSVFKDADAPYRRNRNSAWAKYRRPIERRNAA